MTRRFVVFGRNALASGEFLLDDLPGTSGRFDVLLRCIRAALLHSHGIRRDVVVYLVLLGGPAAPRTIKVDGASAKFVRPDERALATLTKKSLANEVEGSSFVEVRPGVSIANGSFDAVRADLGNSALYVLEEPASGVTDIRTMTFDSTREVAFFLGDHSGFDDELRADLAASGATPISVGPVSLHTDDVVTIVSNELDRAL